MTPVLVTNCYMWSAMGMPPKCSAMFSEMLIHRLATEGYRLPILEFSEQWGPSDQQSGSLKLVFIGQFVAIKTQ